jgi:hypothetical protein
MYYFQNNLVSVSLIVTKAITGIISFLKTGRRNLSPLHDGDLTAADSHLRYVMIVRQDFHASLHTIRQEFISEHLYVFQAFDGNSASFIS